MKIFKPLFEEGDERGVFRELVRGDKWKEVNVAERKKGVKSGNHYHKIKEELFYVYRGKCKVRVVNVKTKDEKTYTFNQNDIFVVEPYEMHEFYYYEDTLFVILLTLPFDKNDSDIYIYNENKK